MFFSVSILLSVSKLFFSLVNSASFAPAFKYLFTISACLDVKILASCFANKFWLSTVVCNFICFVLSACIWFVKSITFCSFSNCLVLFLVIISAAALALALANIELVNE